MLVQRMVRDIAKPYRYLLLALADFNSGLFALGRSNHLLDALLVARLRFASFIFSLGFFLRLFMK